MKRICCAGFQCAKYVDIVKSIGGAERELDCGKAAKVKGWRVGVKV